MKVVDVATFVVGNPPPRMGGRYFIFVKLTTDSGVVGYGEIYTATVSPHLVARMAEEVAARHVVGRDPHQVERFVREVYGRGYAHRPDLTLGGIASGLEMAMWDICGKEAGRPVYDLLGGRVHETLRAYTYLYPPSDVDVYAAHPVYDDPAAAAEAAARYAELGFTAVKFDPAGRYTVYDGRQPSLASLDRSEKMVRAVRESVGSKVDILFGTHGQFTPSGALRMARRIEPYDPLWFEEPCPPDAFEQMAAVARGTSIPISAGERLTGRNEFARLLASGAASIIQPNLGRCGGLLEGKKIAALAEVHQAQVAPHLYCGPIVAAANIGLATCTPNFLVLETIEGWSGFHAELVDTDIAFVDGRIVPSSRPGLGVTLREDVALGHPYTGGELHLEMGERPDPAD